MVTKNMALTLHDVTRIFRENNTSYVNTDDVKKHCQVCLACNCCERHNRALTNGLTQEHISIANELFTSQELAGQPAWDIQGCTCTCRHVFRCIIREHTTSRNN
jgi:hypothetical protein